MLDISSALLSSSSPSPSSSPTPPTRTISLTMRMNNDDNDDDEIEEQQEQSPSSQRPRSEKSLFDNTTDSTAGYTSTDILGEEISALKNGSGNENDRCINTNTTNTNTNTTNKYNKYSNSSSTMNKYNKKKKKKRHLFKYTNDSDDSDSDDDSDTNNHNDSSINTNGNGGGGGGSGNGNGGNNNNSNYALGRKETLAVLQLRRIVIGVLIVSTIGVAIGVYYYLRQSEKAHFQDAFTTDANSILSGIATGISRTLESVDALAVNIVAYATATTSASSSTSSSSNNNNSNDTTTTAAGFPFVTLPYFTVQGRKAMKQAPALYYQVFYHVPNDLRQEWEEYAYENHDWLYQAQEVQRQDDTYFGKTPDFFVLAQNISNNFEPMPPSPSKGFMPAWQTVPITNEYTPYNWDFYSLFDTSAVDSLVETHKAILWETWNLPDPNNEADVKQNEISVENWFRNYVGPDQDPYEPISGIYYPILTSSTQQVRSASSSTKNTTTTSTSQQDQDDKNINNNNNDQDDFVGGIAAVFYWARMLRNILLPNKDGIVVVFDNPCNPAKFTYEINGPEPTYLGRGDWHDSKYDDMKVSSTLFLDNPTYQTFQTSYTGAPLNEDFCPYTFTVYPTHVTEELYLTKSPLLVTIVAALLFAASSGVFLIYDWLVERRQKKVLSTAVRTGALVSTLFPAMVRDQLLDEAANNDKNKNNNKNGKNGGGGSGGGDAIGGGGQSRYGGTNDNMEPPSSTNNKKRLRNFLTGGGGGGGGDDDDHHHHHHHDDVDNRSTLSGSYRTWISGGSRGTTMTKSQRSNNGDKLTKGQHPEDENNSIITAPIYNRKPIAALFPETTVLFADIVGFTAWSSTREPSQVFTLLETVYHTYDEIATRFKVFKVETVGDCYVAVVGVPDQRSDHAIVMAKFVRECVKCLKHLVKRLEILLGPDTADITMRFGLHSGPVTAGVLRGERSRFQLFGDTMNVASRMESTGIPGQVQISEATANLLIQAGRAMWVQPRSDPVAVKGKGMMKTYWLQTCRSHVQHSSSSKASSPLSSKNNIIINSNNNDSISNINSNMMLSSPSVATNNHSMVSTVDAADDNQSTSSSSIRYGVLNSKHSRLVGWITEILSGLLRKIKAERERDLRLQRQRRHQSPRLSNNSNNNNKNDDDNDSEENVEDLPDIPRPHDQTVLEEVQEIIQLPDFDYHHYHEDSDNDSMGKKKRIELDDDVQDQLTEYVATIASLYNENPFHNFEHASHVTMSVIKLMSRIVATTRTSQTPELIAHDDDDDEDDDSNESDIAAKKVLHEQTYGITSDPLTHFACAFSALIHDADHPGVPNQRYMKENPDIAKLYKHRSAAEQNSVDVAWNLLMEPKFAALRRAIYGTDRKTQQRFRQLVVNSVMATDIFDPDLKELRNQRWNKAFSLAPSSSSSLSSSLSSSSSNNNNNDVDDDTIHRKATIVIEHLIQASDVAHTMQHWHIYRKWNERLFSEMYLAYKQGRSSSPTNPADFWYQGELKFFDGYIIPLAKKLKDCGVFGVSSAEYLNYAQQNRQEWELRGQEVIQEILQTIDKNENNNNNNNNNNNINHKMETQQQQQQQQQQHNNYNNNQETIVKKGKESEQEYKHDGDKSNNNNETKTNRDDMV